MKEKFLDKRFSHDSLTIIKAANIIIDTYRKQGFDLTLRQLYYQFVSKNLIANRDSEYKRLGSVINDARLAGLIDWDAITDRTRYVRQNTHWQSPMEIIAAAVKGYYRDHWEGQHNRCTVWIEKDALIGVIEGVCRKYDVPFFSCRGYVSQSEMYEAAKRLENLAGDGHDVTVFHLGDHDPSGVDMTRDIQARLNMLSYDAGIQVVRIALTMEQIDEYNPPPNPAKISDSRSQKYIDEYGNDSWELDALEPTVLVKLIEYNVTKLIDPLKWSLVNKQETTEKEKISNLAVKYLESDEEAQAKKKKDDEAFEAAEALYSYQNKAKKPKKKKTAPSSSDPVEDAYLKARDSLMSGPGADDVEDDNPAVVTKLDMQVERVKRAGTKLKASITKLNKVMKKVKK